MEFGFRNGEKFPKKSPIEYDDEAKGLKLEADRLKKELGLK